MERQFLKQTPLTKWHIEHGAAMAGFGGFQMPMSYEGTRAEHMAVRQSVGIFDVSHMGEFQVVGSEALRFLQMMTTNDVSALEVGQAQYSMICNEAGGVIDDILVYRNTDMYTLVVNAGNARKDFEWLHSYAKLHDDVRVHEVSDLVALIAVQGKNALPTVKKISSPGIEDIKRYRFADGLAAGFGATISRTGYTGEDGFELYVDSQNAEAIWETLLEAGKEYGIMPCGLGARDTLRLEAGLLLHGVDMDENVNPLEAGLGRWVKGEKGFYLGSDAIEQSREKENGKILVGFMGSNGPVARHGYNILDSSGESIGAVTSGGISFMSGNMIGLGYVRRDFQKKGTQIGIDIRGKTVQAEVVKPPFFKPA